MGKEFRPLLCQRAIHFETRVRPRPDPFAVMQIRLRRRAVPRVRFVITPARAERTRPAGGAVGLVVDVMRLEERRLRGVIDAAEHTAELMAVGAGEAMAERDVAVGRHAEQTESGAARMRLAHPFVNFLERIAHVRETVPASGERRLEVIGGEGLKAREEGTETFVLDRVLALP